MGSEPREKSELEQWHGHRIRLFFLGPDRLRREVAFTMLHLLSNRLKSASLLSRTAAAVAAATVATAAFLGVTSLALVSITESIAGDPVSLESSAIDLEGEPVVVATDSKRSGLTPAPRSGTAQNRTGAGRKVTGASAATGEEDP